MSHLRKTLLSRNLKRTSLSPSQLDYAPVKWTKYFDQEETVTTENGSFHVYKKGNTGPVLACLHGGGYSGLTWALFTEEITAIIECQVVAIDLRGHGNTHTSNDNDLSLDTLAKDVVQVFGHLFKDQERVVLVGHSMGGAVAVQCSYLMNTCVGLCIIDIVEGTALDALSSMQSILRSRPTSFKSIQHAIQWCYKGGQTHNIEAAQISMPGQIINKQSKVLAADECDKFPLKSAEEFAVPLPKSIPFSMVIKEVDEEAQEDEGPSTTRDLGKPPLPKSAKNDLPSNGGPTYVWRIDLSRTEQFWSGWFKGLSERFLSVQLPKLLLLANISGLDTALTVGQMQGKFQLQVLAKSGHAIHEDQPFHVAEIFGAYLVKQKLATAKGEMVFSVPGC